MAESATQTSRMGMAYCCGLKLMILTQPMPVPWNYRRKSSCRAIATRQTATVVRTIGKFGCVTLMATRLCSPVQMDRQMEIGNRDEK